MINSNRSERETSRIKHLGLNVSDNLTIPSNELLSKSVEQAVHLEKLSLKTNDEIVSPDSERERRLISMAESLSKNIDAGCEIHLVKDLGCPACFSVDKGNLAVYLNRSLASFGNRKITEYIVHEHAHLIERLMSYGALDGTYVPHAGQLTHESVGGPFSEAMQYLSALWIRNNYFQ